MAKKTTKRKAVKAKAGARKAVRAKAPAARASTVFRQPIAVLQNGFNSVINYFK